jgi:hypothetical protein
MDHAQQAILEAVRAALGTAGTLAQHRVFLDRLDPLQENELPALVVGESPEGEDVQAATLGGLDERLFALEITSVASRGTGYAQRARSLSAEVELCLGAATFAYPRPGRARLTGSRLVTSGESEDPRAMVVQTWRITYYTRRGAPDQAL